MCASLVCWNDVYRGLRERQELENNSKFGRGATLIIHHAVTRFSLTKVEGGWLKVFFLYRGWEN